MPLIPGTRLGNYEIDGPLGSGGMGEVYRARDVRLGRAVAIKSLPDAFARDPERLARFEREARALAAVHHANIATIFGIEDVNGSSYLALELVEGTTLADRIARDGAMSVPDTIEVCAQIAAAVDAAHEQGIVHRDLKPGNVMVTPAGMVKVLDFGLAKAGPGAGTSGLGVSASPTVAFGATAAGAVLGTASYMSPEQARGKDVDRRTDVWALGCILFECLTSRQAFAGETASDVLARLIEREPDWTLLPASVPTRLRDMLRRCLTKNPAERPRDVGDLRGELLSIAADLSSPSRDASAGAPPSIAVLYFQNQTSEPESDYFADGIAEDLLTDLSKLKGLRVASRSSVARYRGSVADTTKVAVELGVGSVLEGSVRRAGNQVRITVRLVSADGFQLWAQRYDRTLENVFAVQEEIAASIAAELKVALTPAETERLGGSKPAEFRAYDFYLKGREQYGHYTLESLRAAIALFEQAIAVDPSYALAHAGIGDCYGQLLQWSNDPPEELMRRGLEATRRAIELDPRLPEAHKAEALIHTFGEHSDEQVFASLRRALDVDPRFTPALSNLGVHWTRAARLAPAERAFRRALDVAPDDPHTNVWLGSIMMMTGRHEESRRVLERVRALSSDIFYVTLVHSGNVDILGALGRAHDLGSALAEARADGADPAFCGVLEAYLAARADRVDAARRLLAEFGDATSLNFTGVGLAAITAMRIGDRKRAAEILRRRMISDMIPVLARNMPLFYPLLDLEALQPRRSKLELVWPLEAPMLDDNRFRMFRKVSIESGKPAGSDVFHDE